jgi:anaerobic selenocysteine-containing dehydrogenase
MTADVATAHRMRGYCSLCIARCGTIATVENGRFTRLDPDPTHPTGAAICAKGRAAPELVYHKDRLTRPLRRRGRKGDPDPGWEEISWDAALDEIAAAMRRIADQFGPHAVAFSQSSPSTTAIADSTGFVRRLMNAARRTWFRHSSCAAGAAALPPDTHSVSAAWRPAVPAGRWRISLIPVASSCGATIPPSPG